MLEERFREKAWLKVFLYAREFPNTDCILWMGHIQDHGYGCLRINGKNYLAHRLVYFLERGPITTGMFVCHHCDIPGCVNIKHLFLGTNADNMADMWKKGRGGCNGRWLRKEKVLEIRAATDTQKEIARNFGVSLAVVSLIKRRKTWKGL